MPTDLKTHIANFRDWLRADTGDAATSQKEREERFCPRLGSQIRFHSESTASR
jgi:hypothetical protein